MIINVDIREQVQHLLAVATRGEYWHLVGRVSLDEWKDVLEGVIVEVMADCTGWTASRPSAIARLDRLISYHQGFTGSEMESEAEFIYCAMLDDIHLEFADQVTPFVPNRSVWEINIHRDHFSLSYVGDGSSLAAAVRAAGGSFKKFLHHYF